VLWLLCYIRLDFYVFIIYLFCLLIVLSFILFSYVVVCLCLDVVILLFVVFY